MARAAVTWSIHSKSETFLESTELAVRASVLGDLTVVVLGTEERRTCAGLQTAQVEFLPTHTFCTHHKECQVSNSLPRNLRALIRLGNNSPFIFFEGVVFTKQIVSNTSPGNTTRQFA